jgi:excisionase family DNA binding protein
MSGDERHLTTREVAELLRIAPATVLTWVEERGLQGERFTSRAIRYRKDKLDAWIEEHATGAAGEREVSPTRSGHAHGGAYGLERQSTLSPTRPPLAVENEKEDRHAR